MNKSKSFMHAINAWLHKEHIIESYVHVCHMPFSKRISIEDKSWKFFILQDTVLIEFCTVTWYGVIQATGIFKNFNYKVTCIKYLFLPYLYDKPQRQLILNHIESKCYHYFNRLPDDWRPLCCLWSSCPFHSIL